MVGGGERLAAVSQDAQGEGQAVVVEGGAGARIQQQVPQAVAAHDHLTEVWPHCLQRV